MAQKIFTNYRSKVESFPLGEENVGILKPGRYSGFDILSFTGNLRIILSHSNKVRKTGIDNLHKSPFGAILLPTGSILHEDSIVELNVDDNVANTNNRIDYVLCEHIYEEVVGGTVAQYSLLKGPLNGEEPVLVNPQTQVLIGKVTITAGGFNNTHISYVPEVVHLLGDLSYTELADWVNEVVIFPTQYLVPKNGIIMFNGLAENVPDGWAICDGDNGTPDLRDRFIVSTGTSNNLGSTGGSNSVNISQSNLPNVIYNASTSSTGGHNHDVTMSADGGHTHTGTTNLAGSHNHGWTGQDGTGFPDGSGDSTTAGSGRSYPRKSQVLNAGNHSHSITLSSAGSHTHNLTLEPNGAHTHSVTVGPLGSGAALENRPAYYALAFIMKL